MAFYLSSINSSPHGSGTSACRRFWLCVFALVALVFVLAVSEQCTARAQESRPSQPLYIMNADGTDFHQLVHLHSHDCTGSPMRARDGKSIYFDAWYRTKGSSTCHTYKVNADGTWPLDMGPGAMPTEDARGTRIATHYYGDKQGVWLGMTSPILVDRDAGSPRWHPHEQQLAYIKWSGGIGLRAIHGTRIGEEEIIVPAELQPYVGFSWSPDGKAIAFYSNRNGKEQAELIVLNVENKESEAEVKATGKIGWIVSWSPDGKLIAYGNFCEETNTRQIFVVDAAPGSEPKRLEGQDKTRNNGGPAWSPDGKQIVFTSGGK